MANEDDCQDYVTCIYCNKSMRAVNFYNANNEPFKNVGRIPYCKTCVGKLYEHYRDKYTIDGYDEPSRLAVEKVCSLTDMYYSDKIFDSALKSYNKKEDRSVPLIYSYCRNVKMAQYGSKTYDNTFDDRRVLKKSKEPVVSNVEDTVFIGNKKKDEVKDIVDVATRMFGYGFENDEYLYLYNEYCDWTSRHECNTKAQEEVFKNICLTKLQLLKATRSNSDTKDLALQLKNWMDAGKLQPKQNSTDTMSDAQSFGTLIDKWENTRPIPEIDPELADVDYLGRYVDVFFKEGLADSLGINIEHSKDYIQWMKELTVEKPEYNDDFDYSGASKEIHEAIFGASIEDAVDGG